MEKAANSNRTRAWQEADRHHLHPFTTHAELREAGPRVVTHAEGVYIFDSEGHRMLDGMAGLWCVQLGYGNEKLVAAGSEALKTLPYYNAFFQCTNPYAAELSELIASLTPKGLDQVLFANSGSEANDTAIKMIRYYWNLKGKPAKKGIITRKDAYHGVTLGAASMSGLKPMHPQFDLPLPGFHHIEPCPYFFGEGGGLDAEAFTDLCVESLERKITELGAENVAAFCGEPVMGAGGMRTPPPGYWPKIQEVCRRHDVLLWSDEVICGFGRTGAWFGCQTYGYEPDVMTVAKGLSSGYQPISATILGGHVGPTIATDSEEMSHGYTYAGHPVAAAVALANVRELQRMDFVGKRGNAVAAYLQQAIQTLADHPLVGEVRGVGFLGAIEIVADRRTKERFPEDHKAGSTCRDFCVENGLIIRAVGDTMIMSPPLIISETEIDELVAIARRCLDLTAQAMKSQDGD